MEGGVEQTQQLYSTATMYLILKNTIKLTLIQQKVNSLLEKTTTVHNLLSSSI